MHREALSLVGVAVLASCGRVGYDLTSRSAAGGRDASVQVVDSGRGDGSAAATGSGGVSPGGASSTGGGAGARDARAGHDAGSSSGGAAPLDSGTNAGARKDAAIDTGPRCMLSPQSLADWCAELPELAAPAVIDGVLECGLATRVVVPKAYNVAGSPDATIEYALAWSAEGLYFYAAVRDPVVLPAPAADPPWEGDSVELYVDSDGVYDSPPKYDPATRQIVIAAPDGGVPARRAQIYAVPPDGVAWTSTHFASYPRPDGYVAEALVDAADLGLVTWPLAAGDHVGFDIGLNVSAETKDGGTQGTRIGQYFLRVDTTLTAGHPFQSVTAFCNPVLVGR
jgi:hypothetical protein